jgi:hypothetical protein
LFINVKLMEMGVQSKGYCYLAIEKSVKRRFL